MGWTSYRATHYKWVGKGSKRSYVVDRKAECDAYFLEGLNRGYYNVLKSSISGSTYYAAVQHLKRYVGKDENDESQYEDIPENERTTFAVIFLTSTNSKDYFNFSYKDMSECSGPYQYDCPKGILDLLSPTDNKYALEWRKACYENIAKKKNPNSLVKLPEGTIIKVKLPFNTQRYSEGTEVTLTKRKWGKRYKWFASGCYFTQRLMKSLEGYYEIIERGEAS